MYLGAHVSVAGGLQHAPARGAEIQAEVIQVFTSNQHRWAAKPITAESVDGFHKGLKQHDHKVCLSHASYLINLASPEEQTYAKSLQATALEMDRCDCLGIPLIVIHPGAHRGSGLEQGLVRISTSLNILFNQKPDTTVTILLEATAGQGTGVGHTFEQLQTILAAVERKDRVAVCLDTAHLFAAGYDFRDHLGYRDMFQAFDQIIGLDKVQAIHLNDSKKDLNTKVDRHARLGQGYLGWEPFHMLLNDPRLKHVPGILETPVSHYREYAAELSQLRKLRKPA